MTFNEYLERMKHTPGYWEAGARNDFSDGLAAAMQERGIEMRELEAKIGKRATNNALSGISSLSEMCRAAYALGCRVRLTLERIESDES